MQDVNLPTIAVAFALLVPAIWVVRRGLLRGVEVAVRDQRFSEEDEKILQQMPRSTCLW